MARGPSLINGYLLSGWQHPLFIICCIIVAQSQSVSSQHLVIISAKFSGGQQPIPANFSSALLLCSVSFSVVMVSLLPRVGKYCFSFFCIPHYRSRRWHSACRVSLRPSPEDLFDPWDASAHVIPVCRSSIRANR